MLCHLPLAFLKNLISLKCLEGMFSPVALVLGNITIKSASYLLSLKSNPRSFS